MDRLSLATFALWILGCAGAPAPRVLEAQAPSPQAFGVTKGNALPEVEKLWRDEFDLREYLEEGVIDFPGPRLGIADGEVSSIRTSVPEILKEFVAPGRWDTDGLSIQEGRIVARLSPTILGEMQSALRVLKVNRQRLIRISVHFLGMRSEALAGFKGMRASGGGLVGIFDRNELGTALRKEIAPGGFPQAPTVTIFHGQKSHVMFLSQKAYTAGYVQDSVGTQRETGTTTEGVTVEVRALANGDRPDQFLLSLDLEAAGSPRFVSAPTPEGTIQIPQQSSTRIRGLHPLQRDQALLLVLPNPYASDPQVPGLAMAGYPLLAISVTADWL